MDLGDLDALDAILHSQVRNSQALWCGAGAATFWNHTVASGSSFRVNISYLGKKLYTSFILHKLQDCVICTFKRNQLL